jgi:deoxycytidine triphosphate deaminase
MVWNSEYILRWAEAGGITPLVPENINNASIDLRWSGRVRRADRYRQAWRDEETLDRLTLGVDELVLLDTLEVIEMPLDAGGMLMLKSSMGRMGLEHLHAGWFDPGFWGTGTLEMKNMAPWPVTIERNQRIVQLVMHQMVAPAEAYAGRYVGQHGPTAAR